jgi:periplasmic divalent cation tolerance protein
MNSQHILVLCGCPNEAVAAHIAATLVQERLAACVNRIAAVRSTYAWNDRLQDEPEVLLFIKTSGSRYAEVELRLRALHPYEVPEIIALPIIGGSGNYLAWLAAVSGAEGEADGSRATQL